MKPKRPHFTSFTLSLWLAATALGQGGMPSAAPGGWDASFTKLFGEIKTFSAKADLRMFDKAGQETMSLGGMSFALLDEKVRAEVDLAQMKSAQMSAEAVAALKQMGMDRVVSFVFPDKKLTAITYPSLKATIEMPMPETETAAALKDAKPTITKLGTETVDDQSCVKNQVTVTDSKGQKRDVLVWNASGMKDFPIRIRFTEGENTIEMRFKQVKFDKPAASLFELPAGYTKYAGFQEFMQGAMQKMMKGGPDAQ
jgi:hypothetical protein